MRLSSSRRWEGILKFDPEADGIADKIYIFNDDSLREKMSELIDASEMILNIWVYKCPIFNWQLTQLFLNHQFVVLETANWWWSIEKTSEEIFIQRSKCISQVRDYKTRERRNTPLLRVSSDKGRKSMRDLIHFLYLNNEPNRTKSDCKDFAKRVFDEIAETKIHGTILGCD